MTRTPFELENFDDAASVSSLTVDGGFAASTEPDSLGEPARLAAYEEGYKSGWDDATRAESESRRDLSAELERNLRNLSFSYFEARDEIMGAIRPFLDEMLSRFFQGLLPEATAGQLIAELSRAVETGCDGKVVLMVAPEDADTVRMLVPGQVGLILSIREEPALASGQARLLPEGKEIAIDIPKVIETVRESLAALAGTDGLAEPKEVQNG